jgi:hypothetical protein
MILVAGVYEIGGAHTSVDFVGRAQSRTRRFE